jgi:hypothetical protein
MTSSKKWRPLALRFPPLLGAEDAGFLLGFADEQHTLVALERREVLLRDVVLPLALLERHQVDPLSCDEALDGLDEPLVIGATITVDGTRAPSCVFRK